MYGKYFYNYNRQVLGILASPLNLKCVNPNDYVMTYIYNHRWYKKNNTVATVILKKFYNTDQTQPNRNQTQT